MQKTAVKSKIRELLRSKWSLLAAYFIMCLYFEFMFRYFQVLDFGGTGLLYIPFFCGGAACLIFIATGLFSPRINKILACTVFVGMALAYGSQIIYHRIFYTYYTIFSMLNGGSAFQFWQQIIFTLGRNWHCIASMLVPPLFMIVFGRKLFNFEKIRLTMGGIAAALAVGLHFAVMLMLPMFGKDDFSPHDLYHNMPSIDYAVEDFGLLTTMRLDAQRLFLGDVKVDDPISADPLPEAPQPPPEEEPVPEPQPQYQPNVLPIDFSALASTESDPTLKAMHEYFAALEPTMKNEKTGMFKGKNLIWVIAESFAPYAIDEELTPTLYKMSQQGFNFNNFYNPIWGVSTSDGEYTTLAGLLPKQGVWSFFKTAENYMPFSIANMLNAEGYTSRAFHNHSYTYYKRDQSHPNMGYDFKGVGGGLEMTEEWPRSDLELVDITTAEFATSAPFHTYYLTVSGHLMYNFIGNAQAIKNRELVENLPYEDEACKAYIACNIELDRAMELLLKRLEEAGQLENTVIAIAPDHYPYGLNVDQISELLGHEVEQDFELYKSKFILYTPGMERESVDEPLSNLDLLPTLSNLFGLSYDSRLLMGRDVFGGGEPLVMFANHSFISDDGRYNTRTGEFTPNEGVTADDSQVEYIKDLVTTKFAYSSQILDNDYYSHLREYIEK